MKNTVASILQDTKTAGWLVAELSHHFSTEALWQQALGLGLTARLWHAERGHAKEYVALLRTGWQSPAAKACALAAQLTPSERAQLETFFAFACDGLMSLLDVFRDAVLKKNPTAGELGRHLLTTRDDLACVGLVLDLAGSSASVQLNGLDRACLSDGALWHDVILPDTYSARLGAVSWQDPEAWWGAVYAG